MQIGFVGLGRMGANMVRRLLRDGHEVVAYNRTPEKTKEIAGEGAVAAFSIEELVVEARRSRGPSGSWSRPATRPRPRSRSCWSTSSRATRSSTAATRTSTTTSGATPSSPRRASATSTPGRRGGIWGLQVGYCLMVGGDREAVEPLEPIFRRSPRRAATSMSAGPGAGPLREDGPQRHRVRADAGLRRGLRDHARVASTRSTSRRSRTCGTTARSSGRGSSSSPAARSRRTARTSSTSRATSPTPARAAGRSRRRSTTTCRPRSSRSRC